MKRLAGKVAIVSGAREVDAIGGATALRLGAEGARVAVADWDLAGAERVARAVVDAGGEAMAVRLDLGDIASIQALFDGVVARFGRVDILHNNAADTRVEQMAGDMAIEHMDPDLWDRAFHINTRGTMLMIKAALPIFFKGGGGAIINTSSGAALRGDFYAPAYAASKAAINCLGFYVATQYGARNIRCNTVSPGLILTPNARANNAAEQLDRIQSHALLPYLGEPRDIAAAVAYLASDDARNVNGQVIVVDGGYISHMPHVADNRDNFAASPAGRSV